MTAHIKAAMFSPVLIEDIMTPVVAVDRARHDGRGGRQRGSSITALKVLTSLSGRSQETAARAKAAGMTGGERRGDRGRRFHSVDLAAGRCAGAGRAVRAGAARQQQQAGLCRLQCHQSGDGRARRGGDRADRMSLRRRRHHRPAAASAAAMPVRDSMLPVRRRRASRRCANTASISACSTAR